MKYLILLLLFARCDSADPAVSAEPAANLTGRWSAYDGETRSQTPPDTITFYELTLVSDGGRLSGSARVVRLELPPEVRDGAEYVPRHAGHPYGDTLYTGQPGTLTGTVEGSMVRFVVDHVNTDLQDRQFAGLVQFKGEHFFSRRPTGRTLEGFIGGATIFDYVAN